MFIGKRKNQKDTFLKPGEKLFCDNAFFLLENADRIFADSRMFLAPVPVVNGLAYTGQFTQAPLGAYLEWWLNDPQFSTASDKKLGDMLIWFISGSPLSGAHACCGVNREGKTKNVTLNTRFSDTWHSFLKYNKRYQDAKSRFAAFDLDLVIDILRNDPDEEGMRKTKLDTFYLRTRINCLEQSIKDEEEKAEQALNAGHMKPQSEEVVRLRQQDRRDMMESCNDFMLYNGTVLRGYTDEQIAKSQYGRIERSPYCLSESQLKCFLGNVRLFIENTPKILANDLFSHVRLPLRIAQGRPGFGGTVGAPTLGAILHWWKEYPESVVIDDEGERWMIFEAIRRTDIGTNTFRAINLDGEQRSVYPESPTGAWETLRATMRQFEVEQDAPAYAIFDIETFLKHGYDEPPAWMEENLRLRISTVKLQAKLNELNAQFLQTKSQYHHYLLQTVGYDLIRYEWNRYKAGRRAVKADFHRLSKEKKRLYRQKRTGEITAEEYELRVKDVNRQRRGLHNSIGKFSDFLKSVGLPDEIDQGTIEWFLAVHSEK